MQCDIRRRRMDSPVCLLEQQRERLTFILSQSASGSQKFTPSPSVCLALWKVYQPTPKFGLRLFRGSEQHLQSLKKFSYHTDPQKQSIKLK